MGDDKNGAAAPRIKEANGAIAPNQNDTKGLIEKREENKMMIFRRCDICGNVVMFIKSSGVTPECCGREMTQLIPNSTDGSGEKHVPVIKILTGMNSECTERIVSVEVGSDAHPMIREHHIQWIVLETNKGYYSRELRWNDQPKADFKLLHDEEIKGAYAYCNLHGLWYKNAQEA